MDYWDKIWLAAAGLGSIPIPVTLYYVVAHRNFNILPYAVINSILVGICLAYWTNNQKTEELDA